MFHGDSCAGIAMQGESAVGEATDTKHHSVGTALHGNHFPPSKMSGTIFWMYNEDPPSVTGIAADPTCL